MPPKLWRRRFLAEEGDDEGRGRHGEKAEPAWSTSRVPGTGSPWDRKGKHADDMGGAVSACRIREETESVR